MSNCIYITGILQTLILISFYTTKQLRPCSRAQQWQLGGLGNPTTKLPHPHWTENTKYCIVLFKQSTPKHLWVVSPESVLRRTFFGLLHHLCSSRSWYFCPFVNIFSLKIGLIYPALHSDHPHKMMLPPLHFIVRMAFLVWPAVLGIHLTLYFAPFFTDCSYGLLIVLSLQTGLSEYIF